MQRYVGVTNLLLTMRRSRSRSIPQRQNKPWEWGNVCRNVWAIARHKRKMPTRTRGWGGGTVLCRDVWPPSPL